MARSFLTFILPLLYFGASLPIFNKVYETSKSVIDEEFHLRQGLHYCNKRFSEWDSKITTFPGLYIVSCILIPINFCTVYGLRLVSLLASALNVYLIFKIREYKKMHINSYILATESVAIALLPPMYFFCHLYYTDILSVTFFLWMYSLWIKKYHKAAAAFGGVSVLMRQTNVVWVVFLLGTSFLEELCESYAIRKGIRGKDRTTLTLLNSKMMYDIICSWEIIKESVINTLKNFFGYILVIIAFVIFVIANGSIVVGDKSAHEATLNVPQIFYFSLFTVMFAVPVMLDRLKDNLKVAVTTWKMHVISYIVIGIIVKLNTVTHPYLLADNRHYTFYIWNRFYGKYEWFKFCVIPLYVLSLQIIRRSTAHLSSGFQIMFWIASVTALCSQKLLEVRYFLIPYIILRLNFRICKKKYILCEFIYNLIINALVFIIFFKKEIIWSNFPEVQRIIW